jgi:hypothetical protein
MPVRVMLGRITAYTGIVDDFGLWVGRGVLGTGTTTTIDNNGLAVKTGGVERVRVGAIGGGDYGLKVTNAGSTTIIDGTSDHFRISASGTLSATALAEDSDGNSVTLSGLGALAATPAHMSFIGPSAAATSVRRGDLMWTGIYTQTLYVAAASGGSPTVRAQAVNGLANAYLALDGSNFATVNLDIYNYGSASSNTSYARYYVLAQSAI